MNRRAWIVVALVLFLAFALPCATSAQTFDPVEAGQEAVSTVTAMFGAAQNLAKGLFLGIFSIEIVIFGIQMALHRDNLAEFFSSMTMKILGFGFFAWLIVNFNLIGQVITGFQQAANQIAGGGSPTALVTLMLTNAGMAFTAAGAAQTADSIEAMSEGIFVLGSGDAGLPIASALGHIIFEPMVMGIAGMEMMGAFAVAFQTILIQIEVAIVSSVGVFFLAFSTSRYTSQYSQGVLSYMFNVGAKLIAFQIFIAIAMNLIAGQTLWNAGALIAAAAMPDGIGSLIPVGLAMVGGFFALLIGALAIAVPGVASSFLTGATTVSGQAALSNMVAGMAGGQALRAGMMQEERLAQQRAEHLEKFQALGFSSQSSAVSMHDVTTTDAASGTAFATSHVGHDEPSPHTSYTQTASLYGGLGRNAVPVDVSAAGTPEFGTYVTAPLAGDPQTVARAIAYNEAMNGAPQSGVGDRQTLRGMTQDDMRALPQAEFQSRLTNTSATELTPEVIKAIQSDPQLRDLAAQQMRQEAQALASSEAMAGSYAASGLTQMVPRGEVQQGAVQIRIEHKD
jgi:P-type conjugative transfer protein TrbL